MTESTHMTISDVIDLADPLEVLAEMDGPVLIPAEPADVTMSE